MVVVNSYRSSTFTIPEPTRISAGIGKISGHMAESLYSGSGISLVTNSFLRKFEFPGLLRYLPIPLPFKPLKHGTLRDIEPTARIFCYCLPDF